VLVDERAGSKGSRRRGKVMGEKGKSDLNRSCNPFSRKRSITL
jgi:hypothetical protein